MKLQEYLSNMTEDMQMRGLSEGSIQTYRTAVSLFIRYCDEFNQPFTEETFRNYLLYLMNKHTISKTTINMYNSAIRFFLEVTLRLNINHARTARFRQEYHYPSVFTVDEINLFFSVIDDVKYRAIFFNMYGSGLRVSEICKLRVGDIDSKNMRILIQQGKGCKDRYTILSIAGLHALREYWKAYHPQSDKGFLFPSDSSCGHLSKNTVQRQFQKFYALSGIEKKASTHTLRHSFATHLLENDVSPLFIKDLLGHATFSSTYTYLHMAHTAVYKTVSPLDEVINHA